MKQCAITKWQYLDKCNILTLFGYKEKVVENLHHTTTTTKNPDTVSSFSFSCFDFHLRPFYLTTESSCSFGRQIRFFFTNNSISSPLKAAATVCKVCQGDTADGSFKKLSEPWKQAAFLADWKKWNFVFMKRIQKVTGGKLQCNVVMENQASLWPPDHRQSRYSCSSSDKGIASLKVYLWNRKCTVNLQVSKFTFSVCETLLVNHSMFNFRLH